MNTREGIAEIRAAVAEWKADGLAVGFVPTMGNLHDGHLRLLAEVQRHCDRSVASVFVNPTQFDRAEDLAAYPRTLEDDAEKLRQAGLDLLFVPSAEALYPTELPMLTEVRVREITEVLEGAKRPGHFDGVATVVLKLFNIVAPDFAAFGKKDYQQLMLIKRLVHDLNLPVSILAVPTEREADGLAMSSRNGYLTRAERKSAPALFRTLESIADRIGQGGESNFRRLERDAAKALEQHGFRPEYIAICERTTLAQASSLERPLVVLAAAWLGRARLIDNLEIVSGKVDV